MIPQSDIIEQAQNLLNDPSFSFWSENEYKFLADLGVLDFQEKTFCSTDTIELISTRQELPENFLKLKAYREKDSNRNRPDMRQRVRIYDEYGITYIESDFNILMDFYIRDNEKNESDEYIHIDGEQAKNTIALFIVWNNLLKEGDLQKSLFYQNLYLNETQKIFIKNRKGGK